MKNELYEQAICSLLSKSDLANKDKEIVKQCLLNACLIKENINEMLEKNLYLDEKRNAAVEASSSINDAIAYMAVFAGRIDVNIFMDFDNGKYSFRKKEVDIIDEIDMLTS